MNQSTSLDIKDRLRPFGLSFEKSLSDLIKGIRSHREPEDQLQFLQRSIQECRQEVKSSDLQIKTMAVLKLSYLEMYGFDMTWSNFQVLEIMSSSKFQQKRIGYLSSLQSFRNDNDVLMLMTNLLKKDLNSAKVQEVSVALSGLANIVSTPLAQDITEDIVRLLKHSKPYVRKKAVLTMYKIFLKYPEALRAHLDQLVEKLEDEDEAVVTATITVFCELSKKTPTLLVPLAPRLYQLLQNTNNNWMLIRLLKLFSSLCLIEPRLKQKLLSPVLQLMSKTKASSLVFECVNCLVQGDMIGVEDYEIAKLCLEELCLFFNNNTDSNLKFVGLLAFHKIGSINCQFIQPYSDYIFQFLTDQDQTIREKAIDLIDGVITEDNLFQTVKTLMIQLIPEDEDDSGSTKTVLTDSYKLSVIQKIIHVSSMSNYANIPSFEWYLSVLVDLLDLTVLNQLPTKTIGQMIGSQFQNIAIRVPSIRKEIIKTCVTLVSDAKYLESIPEVLKDVVWILGEYCEFIANGDDLISSILSKSTRLYQLPRDVLMGYIPALVKVYCRFVNKEPVDVSQILTLTDKLISFLEPLTLNKDFEIQERSLEFHEFLKLIPDAIDQQSGLPVLLSEILPSFFTAWEITPLAAGSQQSISKPFDLDLDSVINADDWDQLRDTLRKEDEDLDEEGDEFEEQLFEDQDNFHHEGMYSDSDDEDLGYERENTEDNAEKKLRRLQRIKDDPYYISTDSSSKNKTKTNNSSNKSEDTIESKSTSASFNIEVEDPSPNVSTSKTKAKKKKTVILSDEIIGTPSSIHSGSSLATTGTTTTTTTTAKDNNNTQKKKKRLLNLDSSNLENFSMSSPVSEQSNHTSTSLKNSDEISQDELIKMQNQLNQTSITENIDQQNQQEEEEVVVIRKKKKSKKKTNEEGDTKEKKKKKKAKKVVDVSEE
ncbi:hypothetical protein WICPIJ_002636 [Wickerhamomyces pijperi]|uniref:AP-3 complex subunit delta n=1 Tax=Wickerhamomyces pijperi TaxID=599730 RepID=A0A9P8Q980_WICPI|nr:hypothetical protein WICPIJ_002636 [Wickerhamomyces pijperi]